jgi:histidinol-phosphate/aromatic aminotransferase/cobyric acid decarboxylase-like protein
MEEDGLNNHIRITIGTREQNHLLMNLIKTFLKENNL